MGLDVYVGPLSRYHAGTWETVVARYAREQGIEYRVARTQENTTDAPLDPQQVAVATGLWRDGLAAALESHLGRRLSWAETADHDYVTDKPDWQGYWALLLHAAHTARPGGSRPSRVPESADQDPAYAKLAAEQFRCEYSQLFEVQLWLPARFDFRFTAQDVTGADILMGSCLTLYAQLQALNRETFAMTPEQLLSARTQGVDKDARFDHSARFGLAMFLALAREATDRDMPMRLDY